MAREVLLDYTNCDISYCINVFNLGNIVMDRDKIRAKLDEIVEYSYSDGAVLFDTSICIPEEFDRLRNSGILDTLARVLSSKPVTISYEMKNSEGNEVWSEWYTCPSCEYEDVIPNCNFCNNCGVKLKWEL